MSSDPCSPEAFEARYRTHEDPWDFGTSPYEQGRYDAIVEALGAEHYDAAFEPACSIGELTVRLAPRCRHLRAVDVSPTAIERAVRRCRSFPQVELAVGSVVDELAPERFDLVVFSELGYYFEVPELDALIDRLAGAVRPGGELVACHWLGTSAHHRLHGSVVHERLADALAGGYEHRHHAPAPGFALDGWRRR